MSSSESLTRRLCTAVRSRLEAAVHAAGAYSSYPLELTASRTLLLSLYHGLLVGDAGSVFALLALEPALPQLGSTSAAGWLCEDFHFRDQDVGVVLSRLGFFIEEGVVPPSVVSAFIALARKHLLFVQEEIPNTKASMISVATQTTSEVVGAQGVFSRLESTPEEIVEEEDNFCPEKLPVVYATSLSVESIPTEIVGELRAGGAKTPQSPELKFETAQRPPKSTCEEKAESWEVPHTPPSAATPDTSQWRLTKSTVLNTGFGHPGMPCPSAPSLSAFDMTEIELEDRIGETEPIYENIPAFKELSSKTIPTVEVVRRSRTNSNHHRYLVENRRSEGSLTGSATLSKLQNRRSDSLLTGTARNMSTAYATRWLLKAAERGNSAEAAVALSSGASTEGKDSLRRSPLHLAVASGHQPLVRMLLDAGADRNKRDTLGRTPLHYVALRGRTDLARMLLDSGADPNIRDSSGLTPTSLAAIKNHRGVAALLKSKGGQECCIS